MDIVKALTFAFPSKEFSVGDSYDSLTCHGWEKPSEAILNNAWSAYLLQQDAQARRNNILAQLASIDAQSIRPLRDGDTARVTSLENQAASLRMALEVLIP